MPFLVRTEEGWSGGSSSGSELGGGIHGSRALARGREREGRWRGERGVSASGGEASGVHQEERRGTGARGSKARQWWGALGGMEDTSRTRVTL